MDNAFPFQFVYLCRPQMFLNTYGHNATLGEIYTNTV